MSPLTTTDIKACTHPRLPLRFALAIVCVLLLAPLAIFFSFFGLISLILLWLIFLAWLSMEVLYAYFVGNIIQVSELNYPRILDLSREVKELLSVKKDYSVFVYEDAFFNAFMMRLFFRRAIFLNSEILETGVSDDEVRWIVGRFVGYWRVQQDTGAVGWAIRMTQRTGILNVLMLPYERAMAYTGDRLGLAAIGGDITSAVSAMQKLLVGRLLGYSVNPVGVVEQARRVKGSLSAFLARVPSAFPHTITRYVDLIAFAKRQFPDQFAKFEAANPGLAEDVASLSGERTSGGSMLKMLGAVLGGCLAVGLTILLWVALAFWFVRARVPALGGLAPPPDSAVAEQAAPASDAGQPESAAPAADSAAADSAASSTAEISDPAIERGIPDSDISAAFPEQAKAAGVSGKTEVACLVDANGEMSGCHVTVEEPKGHGFGDAAVRLASTMKIADKARDGSPVAGRTVRWDIPFKAQQ